MARPTPRFAQLRRSGFTLIEMMIAVAIIAIIAAVAFPSYQASVRKGRRADALAAMSKIQQAQERWRGNSSNYNTIVGGSSTTGLGVAEPELYSLSITAPDSTAGSISRGYIVIAEARGSQDSDSQCRRMSIRMLDGNITYASCATCTVFDYTQHNACWGR
jgi:type IV pilus assembly protein PilE